MPDRITPGELLRAFREYLSVHPDLALSGHAMDNMALDLARVAMAAQAKEAAPAAQAIPDNFWDSLQRLIENGAKTNLKLAGDALLVSWYQKHLLAIPSKKQGQQYQITSIKYLAGELTLRALGNDLTEHTLDGTPVTHQGVAEVPQTLDAGQVVTLQEIGRG